MRKAERLFQLITLLRGRRLAITAKKLADALEVSERTIYRDINALMISGVPIEGEPGVGYLLDKQFDLPPLMFTNEELLALTLGSKMVKTWGDRSVAKGAISALEKITAILPSHLKTHATDSCFLVPDYFKQPKQANDAEQLRHAIENKQVIAIHYCDEHKQKTQRQIEPLGLVYWGGKWTLVAFCRLRQDYREFRTDRIVEQQPTTDSFTTGDIKSLSHYLSQFES